MPSDTIDKITEREFRLFADDVLDARCSALLPQESFIDTSMVHLPFLNTYASLAEQLSAPRVVDYFSDFPVLSLYLLSRARLEGLKVVTNSEYLVRQLEFVKHRLKLPFEILLDDPETVNTLPHFEGVPSELGVSFNGLYSSKKMEYPLFLEGAHSAFGVFVHTPVSRVKGTEVSPERSWPKLDYVKVGMASRYNFVDSKSFRHEAVVAGFQQGDGPSMRERVEVDLHYVIGRDA
jgi:hypothetical protein